jgi:hypothetical protein
MKLLRVTIGLSLAALGVLLSSFLQPPAPKAAPATAAAAAATAATSSEEKIAPGLVSDFDGSLLSTTNGMRWLPTTDKYIGGASTVTPSLIEGGAGGSAGAMRMAGDIAMGTSWSWAGVMLNPGANPMTPVDARACTELVFQARGDGRELAVLLFSGKEMSPSPPRVMIHPGKDWGEVRLRLAQFPGADLAQLRAIAITAGLPAGAYQFDIDAVEIR